MPSSAVRAARRRAHPTDATVHGIGAPASAALGPAAPAAPARHAPETSVTAGHGALRAHIPELLVLPARAAANVSEELLPAAHRWPSRPSPVVGASLSLLGLPEVESACRPYVRRRGGYAFARFSASDPVGARRRRGLHSVRLPKV